MSEDLKPKDFMILFAEDDGQIIEFLEFALKTEGFLYESAPDGEIARDKFENLRPDLVIVDLMLPKISGYELIKHIRTQYSGKSVPIIVITAKRLDDKNVEMLKFELNVNEILIKPFPKVTLISTIYKFLGIKWADMTKKDDSQTPQKLIIER